MKEPQTREKRHQFLLERRRKGLAKFGLSSRVWQDNPRRFAFVLAHSEFVTMLLQRFFQNVFVFSMNDEVVHPGFYPMAHYVRGIGCGKR